MIEVGQEVVFKDNIWPQYVRGAKGLVEGYSGGCYSVRLTSVSGQRSNSRFRVGVIARANPGHILPTEAQAQVPSALPTRPRRGKIF